MTEFLAEVGKSPITVWGGFLLIGLFFACLPGVWVGGAWRRVAEAAPILLTSGGILGTFIGVLVGLQDFDSGGVRESIQPLLDGLKIAFTTSVVGMSLGLLFKGIFALFGREGDDSGALSARDFLKVLKSQESLLQSTKDAIAGQEESSLAEQMKLLRSDLADRSKEGRELRGQVVESLTAQEDLLRSTKEAIAGDEESSLAGQMKLLRSDLADRSKEGREMQGQIVDALTVQVDLLRLTKAAISGDEESSLAGRLQTIGSDLRHWNAEARRRAEEFQTELWKQLAEFSEMLSKAATEQVVEALRTVIADFNKKLTEQFGDNFKQLNAAVEKLVEWQEGYRQQLIDLHKLYAESVKAVKTIETAVARIADSTESIPASMARLESVVEMAKVQLDQLEEHLDAFRTMRDRAVEAIPEIQTQVTEMVTQIGESVQAATAQQKVIMEGFDAFTRKQGEEISRLTQSLVDVGERVQNRLQEVQDEISESAKQVLEKTRVSIDDLLRAQAGQIDSVNEHLQKLIQQEFERVDSALEEELTRVTNDMGRALSQISGKFTEDYSRLTDAMGEIVGRFGRASRGGQRQ